MYEILKDFAVPIMTLITSIVMPIIINKWQIKAAKDEKAVQSLEDSIETLKNRTQRDFLESIALLITTIGIFIVTVWIWAAFIFSPEPVRRIDVFMICFYSYLSWATGSFVVRAVKVVLKASNTKKEIEIRQALLSKINKNLSSEK